MGLHKQLNGFADALAQNGRELGLAFAAIKDGL
jgi:hypothetical protein